MALPTISVFAAEAVEGVDLQFNVTLSAPSDEDVTVAYKTVSGTALNGVDFYGKTATLIIPAGQTVGVVTIDGFGERGDEPDEAFALEFSNPVGATFAGGGPLLRATGVILDDDGTGSDRALFVSDATVVESNLGGRLAVFEIRLSEASDAPLSFAYTTVDGSAAAGPDYVATSGTIRFQPRQTVATVEVRIVGDRLDEATESFSLVVKPTSAIKNGADGAAGEATLLDDDSGDNTLPVLSVLPAESLEGVDLQFNVVLSKPSDEDVAVQYRTVSGTALNGVDYYAETATLVIPAGQTVGVIKIDGYRTSDDEPDEAFTLELSNPDGATFAGGGPLLRATGVILDDGGAGSDLALFVGDPVLIEGDAGRSFAAFEVRLSEAYDRDVSFRYATADGTAQAGSDYVAKSGTITFAAGQTVASVKVAVIGDRLDEATESFSLVVRPTSAIKNGADGAAGEATILDDDTGDNTLPVLSVLAAESFEGVDLQFNVVLSKPSDEDIAVQYKTVSGTALNDVDFYDKTATLIIPAGQTVGVVTIDGFGERGDEPDEAFTLEFSNPVGATFAGGGPLLRATGVILDDDGTGSDLALFVGDPILVEGDAGRSFAAFEVRLSQAYDRDVSFRYATADGTAKAGSDYVAESGVVTFKAGQTVAAVHVAVNGDGALEGAETFSLNVTPTTVIKNGSADASGVATIFNDDTIDERLVGTPRGDVIRGGEGRDEVYGRLGNDRLYGDAGADRVFGEGGADQLFGGVGNDALDGGDGNDRLLGGSGRDQLSGGAGGDVFAFGSIADSRPTVALRDVILDFDARFDTIDLSAIDADTRRVGDQMFDFIEGEAFSRTAGELRFGNGLLFADVNGDAVADFAVQLARVADLSASDFVL